MASYLGLLNSWLQEQLALFTYDELMVIYQDALNKNSKDKNAAGAPLAQTALMVSQGFQEYLKSARPPSKWSIDVLAKLEEKYPHVTKIVHEYIQVYARQCVFEKTGNHDLFQPTAFVVKMQKWFDTFLTLLVDRLVENPIIIDYVASTPEKRMNNMIAFRKLLEECIPRSIQTVIRLENLVSLTFGKQQGQQQGQQVQGSSSLASIQRENADLKQMIARQEKQIQALNSKIQQQEVKYNEQMAAMSASFKDQISKLQRAAQAQIQAQKQMQVQAQGQAQVQTKKKDKDMSSQQSKKDLTPSPIERKVIQFDQDQEEDEEKLDNNRNLDDQNLDQEDSEDEKPEQETDMVSQITKVVQTQRKVASVDKEEKKSAVPDLLTGEDMTKAQNQKEQVQDTSSESNLNL